MRPFLQKPAPHMRAADSAPPSIRLRLATFNVELDASSKTWPCSFLSLLSGATNG
jgi:hypothetical protein